MKQTRFIPLVIIAVIILIGVSGGVILLLYFYATEQAAVVEKIQATTTIMARQATATRTQEERVATVQAQFTATAVIQPTPSPTSNLPTRPPSGNIQIFNGTTLGFKLEYPGGWHKEERDDLAIFAPSDTGLTLEDYSQFVILFGRSRGEVTLADLLTSSNLPAEGETLNQGSIQLGSQPWRAAQQQLVLPDTGAEVTATVAVSQHNGQNYYMVAVAPSGEWNAMRPTFQLITNSFEFIK